VRPWVGFQHQKRKDKKKKKNPFIQELELVIFEYYSRPAGRFGEKNDIE
jgi:hypothetical protein